MPRRQEAEEADPYAQTLQDATLELNRKGQLSQGLVGAAVHATDNANKTIFDAFAPDE